MRKYGTGQKQWTLYLSRLQWRSQGKRPVGTEHPLHWADRDDCAALMRLMSLGRLDLHALIEEVHSPVEAPEVYTRLLTEKDFPVGVVFDWSKL